MKTIKKLSLLCLFCMVSIGASAYSFESGGIYYNITSSTKLTCEVTYENYTYISNYKGIVNIPTSVSYNEKTYSVTNIGDRAFYDCKGLSYVVIPNSVTSIGSSAFSGCTSLTSVMIPNSVTSIGESAFYDCTGLKSVTIGNSVTSIGRSAFSGCTGLTSIEIPNSVTSIGEYAFYDCTGLKSATIGNSVTSIGTWAFYVCRGLTSIKIPNSVTSIGYNAFYGCSGLTSIVVESGNKYYDSRENCNALIETATNTLITGCMNTIIPNSVASVGSYAFYKCSGLTSITIPNSVTSIGSSAFYDCIGLTSVTIGNSVTSIGGYAFYGCSGLTSITIPNSVTSIGSYAFAGCSGLTSVTNLATIPQKINSSVFTEYGTLHVVMGCKDVYANADYWKKFTIVDDVEVVKVTSVTIDESTYYCDVNGIGQATATIKPDDAFDKKVTWSCSDPSKLFVVANTGQFVGLAVGEVTITATATDGSGVFGQAIVVVQEPSGIEEVEASPMSSPEGKYLYNLQGQKVSVNGFSGVVIHNGKKYLMK